MKEDRLKISTWKLLDLHKSKQGNSANLNISFSMEMKKELLRWDLNILLMRQMLYQLSYRGSSAGWAESMQYKVRAV